MLGIQKLLGLYNAPYCPQVKVINVLKAEDYMGVWHEQTRVKNEWFQSDSSVCTQAYYFDLKESGEFLVENSTQEDLDQERIGKVGYASCSSGDGNCNVSFTKQVYTKSNYKILDTDYDNYSIVYSCFLGKEYLWILTRDPQVSVEYYKDLTSKVMNLLPEFDQSRLIGQEYQGDKCTYITPEFIQ